MKVIVKTGSVEVEATVKAPQPLTNYRELLAPEAAAGFPTKDEVVQIIEIGYTVFQALKILWLSVKGWFKKTPTA